MDEVKQLWDDDTMLTRYRVAFNESPNVHIWAFLCWMRDELTAGAQGGTQRWQPVEDGDLHSFLAVQDNGETIAVFVNDDYGYAEEALPDNVRVCRLVQVDAPGTVDTPAQGVQALSDDEDRGSHTQYNVLVSPDTLAFMEAFLDRGDDFSRSVMRIWLDRAWHTINGEWPDKDETETQRPDATAGIAPQAGNAG